MVRKYTAMLLVIVASILVLNRIGEHGLPFSANDVSCVRFRYSSSEGTQVVVRDMRQIAGIMAALNLKPCKPSSCDFEEQVVFTVAGVDQVALVDKKRFDMLGRYRGYFEMPAPFYMLMQAYRDSVGLREEWDGKYAYTAR